MLTKNIRKSYGVAMTQARASLVGAQSASFHSSKPMNEMVSTQTIDLAIIVTNSSYHQSHTFIDYC
jgi:hypothetical protein